MAEAEKFYKTPGNAKYKGDITDTILKGGLMGPTTFGQYVAPLQASYDPETDLTTVIFRTAVESDFQ